MNNLFIKHLSPNAVIAPVTRLHLVASGSKSGSDIEASQPDNIYDLVGLSNPKEIKPSSSKTNRTEKSPEHLQAIKDVELFRAGNITATELRRKYAATYTNWSGMKTRCRADRKTGISPVALHPSFDRFADFLETMGPRPEPTWSLDRIDPTGPYSPDNVRWASKTTQARNRTHTVVMTCQEGITRPLVEWAEIMGENPDTYRGRKRDGWTDEEILNGHRTLPTSSALQRPRYSRDPFEYTPWHPKIREEFERRFQRYRRSGEHRLAFAKRYTEEWMAAITEEAERCWWPEYHTPTEAEVAKLEELSRDYSIWESNHRYNAKILSGNYRDRLYGQPYIPESVEAKLRTYT